MKRIYNILLTAAAMIAFLPTLSAQGGINTSTGNPNSYQLNAKGIGYSKDITGPDDDGVYTIHLHTFVAGNGEVIHSDLPADVVQTEGVEWQTLPEYDRIHIAGATEHGIIAQVTRAGQPGSLPREMLTHPLITAEPPARARGIAELAQAGRIATVTISLPVLPETGIIEPGHYLRYRDGIAAAPLLGAVRSVSINWTLPTLRQQLTVETHEYDTA